jgi:chromate transport protein ChrA
MGSFLSESYLKPKLTESYLINKMIKKQKNEITFESMTYLFIKDFIYKYWKIIITLIFIIGLLYWRYYEVQNIRKNNLNKHYINKYEEDSEYYTSEEN